MAVRIVHLITGTNVGGAEIVLRNLVTRMDRARFENVVVSMTPPGPVAAEIADAGIAVETLDAARGRADPRLLVRFLRVVRRRRPDVVQTWLYHSDLVGAVAMRLGARGALAWNLRCANMTAAGGNDMVSPLIYRVLAFLSSTPEAVVVNSEAGRLLHVTLGYHPRRWELIPNGFDARRFAPDAAARGEVRRQLGIADTTIVAGLIARLDPMKDHATFLKAASIAAAQCDLQFILAGTGTGEDNSSLRQQIAANGLGGRVHALGERRDIERVFAALDVGCLSSVGEGFPNALGEAMASAVPVIGTDVGDIRWLVGEEAGIVVPPSDPAAFAAALVRLAGMPAAARRAMGDAARRRIVENFSMEAAVRRYEDLYASLAVANC